MSWQNCIILVVTVVGGGYFLTTGQNQLAQGFDEASQVQDVSLADVQEQDLTILPRQDKQEASFGAQAEEAESKSSWHEIPSLAGSTLNGDIKEDQNGNLIIDRDLRRLFDYFLSLRGRYSFEEIQELFLQAVQDRVGDHATQQVFELLQSYQNYLNESVPYLSEIKAQPSVEDFDYLLNQRKNLRRSYLGDEASEAFFQDEERYEDHQLMVLRISTDPNLTADEKKQMLAANDTSLPQHLYINRQKTFAYSRLKSDLSQTKDAASIYETVAERFGEDAAQRYVEAIQAEKTWQQTVNEYFAKKESFLSNQEFNAEKAELRWRQLSESLYDRRELVRLRAIESERQTMH